MAIFLQIMCLPHGCTPLSIIKELDSGLLLKHLYGLLLELVEFVIPQMNVICCSCFCYVFFNLIKIASNNLIICGRMLLVVWCFI